MSGNARSNGVKNTLFCSTEIAILDMTHHLLMDENFNNKLEL